MPGLEEFAQQRTTVERGMTGLRMAKDRAAAALTQS
jgi:hypothetical protein